MKVTIVGAGNVGATCADVIAYRGIASEVVLLDIKEGFAEGKALDIMQCASNTGFNTRVVGVTNDYSKTAGSDVVVITSGIPRKPGMTLRRANRYQCRYCKVGFRKCFAILSKYYYSGCF